MTSHVAHEAPSPTTPLRERSQKVERAPKRISSDDGLVMAIELVATPALFALGGFGLDTWLGTRPLLTILLGLIAFVGKLATELYRYSARMEEHHTEQTKGRQDQPSPTGLRRGSAGASNTEPSQPSRSGLPTGVKLIDELNEPLTEQSK